jgi:hypothetical protein
MIFARDDVSCAASHEVFRSLALRFLILGGLLGVLH